MLQRENSLGYGFEIKHRFYSSIQDGSMKEIIYPAKKDGAQPEAWIFEQNPQEVARYLKNVKVGDIIAFSCNTTELRALPLHLNRKARYDLETRVLEIDDSQENIRRIRFELIPAAELHF